MIVNDDIYVEPIVKLSAADNLTTGEEEEECKFEHRSKLFRFHYTVKPRIEPPGFYFFWRGQKWGFYSSGGFNRVGFF